MDTGGVELFHAGLDRDHLGMFMFDLFAEVEAYIAWAREDYNTVKVKQNLWWMKPKSIPRRRTCGPSGSS